MHTARNAVLIACIAAAGAAMAQSSAAQTAPAASPSARSAEVFVQTGHALHVTVTAFSPDGQRLATCDGVGAVIGWDVASGRQYRELQRHTGMCLGLAFTPDGANVISSGGAASGNQVVMTRWSDGQPVQSWSGYPGQVVEVAATPDGRGAWALGDKGVLLRWALGSDAPVQSINLLLPGESQDKVGNHSAMVLSAAQDRAFIARKDGVVLSLPLAPGGTPVQLARFAEDVSSLALSPDGKLLAVALGSLRGSTVKDVILLDAATGREQRRLSGHSGAVLALAFSPDGRLLASAAQMDLGKLLAGSIRDVQENESLRLWRVEDGVQLADMRNQRNRNGTPFLRGSLAFSPAADVQARAQAPEPALRIALGMWDEAPRVYEVDPQAAAGTTPIRLVRTLEGRGLAARQLVASDAAQRLMVSDGRPRVEPRDTPLRPDDLRREFGREADWTAGRVQRIGQLYSGIGMSTKVQRASLWDLKSGKLDQIIDWQRGPTSDLGVDAQGRFTSVAPMFPYTVLIAPLKSRIVRQATADAQGNVTLRHFGYEPWDGPPDEIFTAIPAGVTGGPAAGAATLPTQPLPTGAGAYNTDIIVQSPAQRWTAIAGIPIQSTEAAAANPLRQRVFVQERLQDGAQVHRHDIAMPGVVRAMAVSADERTLWVSGTAKGQPYDMAHEAWLLAVNLADGQVVRQWALAQGLTVDGIAAHPGGDMAITNGGTNLSVWDRRQDARKYFVKASDSLRPVRALSLTPDGKTIAAADVAGWTVVWDWAEGAEPVPRWARQLAAPAPHLLSFMNGGRRIAAGAPDGSIRLLATNSGDEAARMIRFDNDEWITIIPEGYFVASQDGDRWLNVRMDGKVYGIDQFYDVFYRPDIVERRLTGKSITGLINFTLQDALEQPPPRVTLTLSAAALPAAGQKLRVALQADTLGGGVGEVRLMHNGKLVEVFNRAVLRSGLAQRPADLPAASAPSAANASDPAAAISLQPQGAGRGEEVVTRALVMMNTAQKADGGGTRAPLNQVTGEATVELVPGENAFTVIGFNAPGNLNARPLTRALNATGTLAQPRVFLLAVGIDEFRAANAAPRLNNAVKDSSDLARALRERLGQTYRNAPVVVRSLQNSQATRAALVESLAQLEKEMLPSDLLVWFVASHGTVDAANQYGIVLHDWDGSNRVGSLFSATEILEASRRIKAFNQFVILDTCHAGGVDSLVRGLYDSRLSVLARNMGLHLFASASATEEAIDNYQGNGLFTHTLLEGLKGNAADRNADRQVTINELGDFARRTTMTIAQQKNHSQEPLLLNFGKDVTVYAIP